MIPRMGRIATWLAVILTATGAPAQAQDLLDRLIGQPIAGVEVQIEGRAETAAPLLALVDIKPGERFTIETYRRVADRFNQVPRFETVRVKVDERPAGLILIFDLEPHHAIDRLEFPGEHTGLGAATLQRLVRERFSGLPAFTRTVEIEDAVRRILEEEGFRSATVASGIERRHDPDRATLNLHVQAGDRTTIRSIRVAGESPWSSDDILKRLDLAVGQPYRDRLLLAGLARLRDDLRAKGYYTASADYEPALDGTHVDLVLTINAGPLVRLVVNGELPGSEDEFIPIRRLGSADDDLLFDSRTATEREWRRRGYWRASVQYAVKDADGERVVTFTVDRGKRYRIAGVELPPDLHVTQADVAAIPALRKDAWFSEDAVSRALVALAAIYQQDGYWKVSLDPKYQEVEGRSAAEGGVLIVPNFAEGPRAFITGVTFELAERAAVSAADLRRVMRSQQTSPPSPFSPGNLVYDRQAVPSYYERQGFLNHRVEIAPAFNAAQTEVVLNVKATEGARVVVGEITVVGNERYSRESILNEITLIEGQPYSESARIESQRRLYNLGLRSVTVTAQPRLPGETETRVVVSVVETGSVTFGFGGGLEGATRTRNVAGGGVEDRLEFSPRGSIDIGRRNLGGRNRSISLFSRVSLKPRNSEDPALDGRGFGFAEYRVSTTFQERYAFRSNSDVLLGVTSEQAVRSTFSFRRDALNADLVRPLPRGMSFSGRYSLERTRVFDERLSEDEQSLIDRLFPQVRLSIVSATLYRDRRDNQAAPTRGNVVTGSIDVAPRWIGSEVGFVKSSIEGAVYRSLVPSKRAIFAGRAILGMARGFERRVIGDDGSEEVVADLPASQRFFSGGSNTVRGFQLDRLGVREILTDTGLSDGGNAMLILNAELRLASGLLFGKPLTTVGFLDAGNVFDRLGDLDLSRLRAAAGFGVRYDSFVGPIRLDVGFKLDRFTFPKAKERRWELHLSLFEVF